MKGVIGPKEEKRGRKGTSEKAEPARPPSSPECYRLYTRHVCCGRKYVCRWWWMRGRERKEKEGKRVKKHREGKENRREKETTIEEASLFLLGRLLSGLGNLATLLSLLN